MSDPTANTRVPGPGCQWDAGLYDEKHAFVWKHGASLVELLAPRPGERILDLGCGTGHLTAQIQQAGAEVLGMDRAPSMIEQARREHPELRFEVGDARAFAFPEPFDAVFSNAVLHWVNDAASVIACVRRALRPGGRFVAEFGGKGNVRVIIAAIDHATRTVTGQDFEHPWYYPSVAEYAALLEQGGLEVTFATLFDRPTALDGPEGLRHWLQMFVNESLRAIPQAKQEEFFQLIEAELRPQLFRDNQWWADYRRLRVVARAV